MSGKNEYNLRTQIERLKRDILANQLLVEQLQCQLDELPNRREENPPEIEWATKALASNSAPLMRQRIEQLKARAAVLGARMKGLTDGNEIQRLAKIRNSWYDLREQLNHRATTLESNAAAKQKEIERLAAGRQEREDRAKADERLRIAKENMYEKSNS